MNIVPTKNKKSNALFLSDGELLALGFVLINLLGETGLSYSDRLARSLTPTLLSDAQVIFLQDLLNLVRHYHGSCE